MTHDLFTIESTLSLTGAVSIVFVICNSCQSAFNFNPKWFALAVSIAIALLGVTQNPKSQALDYFVGVLNGFLIFCTSAGATQAVGKSPTSAAAPTTFGGRSIAGGRRKFLTTWFD
jgi:hypothetical protein